MTVQILTATEEISNVTIQDKKPKLKPEETAIQPEVETETEEVEVTNTPLSSETYPSKLLKIQSKDTSKNVEVSSKSELPKTEILVK
jgi:hypothetical protein